MQINFPRIKKNKKNKKRYIIKKTKKKRKMRVFVDCINGVSYQPWHEGVRPLSEQFPSRNNREEGSGLFLWNR